MGFLALFFNFFYCILDGIETDHDIGNYERFLNIDILSDNYMTTGRVYESVIHRERNLEYNGKCVEVVPHIPLEVIGRIKKVAKNTNADFVLIDFPNNICEFSENKCNCPKNYDKTADEIILIQSTKNKK